MSRILLIPASVLLLLSGCVPAVAWKPDSSGFVYTDKKGSRLVEYDLKAKKSRVLVADTGTKTVWPAVSPDGKRIAVARSEKRKGLQPRVQVIFYTSDGKEVSRSSWYEHADNPGTKDEITPSWLLWGPQDRLFVDGSIYHAKKDQFIPVPNCFPWFVGMLGPRPDGKGFLAILESKSDDEEKLAFVDWDGKSQPLAGTSKDMKNFALVAWDREVALLQAGSRLYEADTGKLAFAESKRKPLALLDAPGTRLYHWAFPGDESVLCFYETVEANQKAGRIEVQNLKAKTRKVVKSAIDATPVVFPSPDRKYVAMYYSTLSPKVDKLLVLDATGEVVGEVELES